MSPLETVQALDGALLIGVICGLLFIEEMGVPIPFAPGDLLLALGGIAIASDSVDPVPLVASVLVATVAGAMLGREIFALVGSAALLRLADRLRFRGALDRVSAMVQRSGWRAVLVGRLIPGLRVHTTQVAGVTRMPRRSFLAGLLPAVCVYIAVFVGLGALIGQRAVDFFHASGRRVFVVAVTVLVGLAFALSIRWLVRRGALETLAPLLAAGRRQLADEVEARIPWRGAAGAQWRAYPLGRRLLAALLDAALVVAVAILLLTVASITGADEVVDVPWPVAIAAVALLYRIPSEAVWGHTIGKWIMGISVGDARGRAPGWCRAAVRNLVAVVVLLWPLDAILIWRSRVRRRLGDTLAGTTVQAD